MIRQMFQLTLARHFSSSSKLLKPSANAVKAVYGEILREPSFRLLKGDLPQNYESMKPYDFSKVVRNLINESEAEQQLKVSIHNKMIEKLTKYDYSIAAIHSKELSNLSGILSINGFVELAKSNPGRVKSSWELFLEYLPYIKNSDKALEVVLDRLLFVDGEEVDGGGREPSVEDLARALVVIEMIQSKKIIPEKHWRRLIERSVATKSSNVIPHLLKYCSLKYPYGISYNDCTNYQFFQLTHGSAAQLLEEDKETFLHIFKLIGENQRLDMTEEETIASARVHKELQKLVSIDGNVNIDLAPSHYETSSFYKDILSMVRSSGEDQKNFELSKAVLRTLGMFRDDTETALNLYHSYMVTNAAYSKELMYEMFLIFVHQAYKTSKKEFLTIAKVFIPQDVAPDLRVNIFRALILAYSKFEPENSLEIFNSHIQEFSKEVNPQTFTSLSGLLTETLILAQLVNKDREFARVVLEGAVREEVLSGPTAIKRAKAIFSSYGELIEEDNFQTEMQKKVLTVLQTL